jgi:hypothetical protein
MTGGAETGSTAPEDHGEGAGSSEDTHGAATTPENVSWTGALLGGGFEGVSRPAR